MKTNKNTITTTAILLTIAAIVAAPNAHADEPADAASTSIKAKVAPSVRPMFYVNGMAAGGMIHEDGDNRLTSLDSQELGTGGLLLRGGGVIHKSHLVGVLAEGTWRETHSILDSEGGDDETGAVGTLFIGPEYRYMTSIGVYFGASVGFSALYARNQLDDEAEPACDSDACLEDFMQESDDHAMAGFGFRGTVGYEWRFHKYFAANVEAYGGWLYGEDEHDREMRTPTYGIALGIGI